MLIHRQNPLPIFRNYRDELSKNPQALDCFSPLPASHSPNNTFSTGFSITRPFRESGIKESALKLLQKAGEIAAQEQKVEIRNLANLTVSPL